MRILGIETSCDETAAAVVESASRRRLKMLSNVVASSVDLHAAYGGVVPEIAARSHIESIIPVIDRALNDAFGNSLLAAGSSPKKPNTKSQIPNTDDLWSQIDAIAVTQGPGLSGSLLIGVLTARTLAIAKDKPLYAVNHLLAHVYAAFINEIGENVEGRMQNVEVKKGNKDSKLHSSFLIPYSPPRFPILALIVSGGHTMLVHFKNHFDYKLLGQTADDAVGEAFDKVAKMLGLPYPGGPSIAEAAAKGNPKTINFPRAQMKNPYDFSFSGLKTAVLRTAQELSGHDYTLPSTELPTLLSGKQKTDIAASFQRSAVKSLVDKTLAASQELQPKSIVVAGGVAANHELRKQMSEALKPAPTISRGSDRTVGKVIYPDIKLCTDNGAMIAALGFYQASTKRSPADPYALRIEPSLSL